MNNVYIVIRDYDYEGYSIVGVYEKLVDAHSALIKNNNEGYGDKYGNRVVEIKLNTYFDIGDIDI